MTHFEFTNGNWIVKLFFSVFCLIFKSRTYFISQKNVSFLFCFTLEFLASFHKSKLKTESTFRAIVVSSPWFPLSPALQSHKRSWSVWEARLMPRRRKINLNHAQKKATIKTRIRYQSMGSRERESVISVKRGFSPIHDDVDGDETGRAHNCVSFFLDALLFACDPLTRQMMMRLNYMRFKTCICHQRHREKKSDDPRLRPSNVTSPCMHMMPDMILPSAKFSCFLPR